MTLDNIRDRVKELRRERAGDLLTNPSNWRTHPKSQKAALQALLSEIGYADVLLARETDAGLVLIDGHLRASLTPDAIVPVLVLDLDEAEADKLLLTLDPLAAMATADGAALEALMASVQTDSAAVRSMLEGLALQVRIVPPLRAGLTDPDAVPEPPAEPITRPGDLVIMGDHRLVCADSTNSEDVARLMAGEKASLLATDPPYLVGYEGSEHAADQIKAKPSWDQYDGPEAAVAFFKSFLAAALPHFAPKTAIYQWHATIRQRLVERSWEECGLHLHQSIIWVKPRPVLGRSHFLWQHEPCFYGWVEGRQPEKKPPAYATTVWQVGGEHDVCHPTQKPVELFLRPIEYHTEIGDIVLEPFCGSGTQIIAAERSGRRCFALEQDPGYVDLAVLRWEQFTGREAERFSRG